MAVKSLHKRRMISKKKRKTPAQRLYEMMQKHKLSQEQVQETIALKQHGGGRPSKIEQAILDLPPLKFKIPKISRVAKKVKAEIRHQRKRAIKGSKDIIAGKMVKSSWISELAYFESSEKIHTIFEGRKYTFWNVPETLFNAWYAGAAATRTADKTKARRWNLHDFPSLGAFFNLYIKNKYTHSRGWL